MTKYLTIPFLRGLYEGSVEFDTVEARNTWYEKSGGANLDDTYIEIEIDNDGTCRTWERKRMDIFRCSDCGDQYPLIEEYEDGLCEECGKD